MWEKQRIKILLLVVLSAYYTGLEERLAEAKEARVSLNAMRRKHQEKVRQQQVEMEMLARIQMQQKLELLRQQRSEQAQHLEELQRSRQTAFQQQIQQQQQVMDVLVKGNGTDLQKSGNLLF